MDDGEEGNGKERRLKEAEVEVGECGAKLVLARWTPRTSPVLPHLPPSDIPVHFCRWIWWELI